MKLFGWEFKQWARAAGMLGQHPKNANEALALKLEYEKAYNCAPCGEPLIATLSLEDNRAMNYEAAADLFSSTSLAN